MYTDRVCSAQVSIWNLFGTRSDIGLKFINEELNQDRVKEGKGIETEVESENVNPEENTEKLKVSKLNCMFQENL